MECYFLNLITDKEIVIAIITAGIGFIGARLGAKKTLEATRLSIENEEQQNRIILMSLLSHIVLLIENCNSIKDYDRDKLVEITLTFNSCQLYKRMWDLLPKAGLNGNEIKILYIFIVNLEEAYNHYIILKEDNSYSVDDIGKVLLEDIEVYKTDDNSVLLMFSKNNLNAVKKVIKKYFEDVNYDI